MKEFIKKINLKDIIIRLIKTFIQAFLGALAITLPSNDISDMSVVKALMIGAFSAGISAMMNLLINLEKGE